ncbi:MAG: hypothetical protein PW844_10235 [Pantoea sp.]|uniref:hypothetical protein n=1 Tax=Pantoea sp. TaxID=69393 RepID=UPI002389C36F|nr:hypothetical protein [Pantoea sp.]MDE1186846.1 hypothetical protein [Pantoea sp.]
MTEPISMTDLSVSKGAKPRRTPRLARRDTLEVRPQVGVRRQAAILAVSVAVGLLICAGILMAAGVDAGGLLDEFILETLFDGQNLRAVLFQAAPLMMIGLAASLAFRPLLNLGLEGQMIFGAIAATALTTSARPACACGSWCWPRWPAGCCGRCRPCS